MQSTIFSRRVMSYLVGVITLLRDNDDKIYHRIRYIIYVGYR